MSNKPPMVSEGKADYKTRTQRFIHWGNHVGLIRFCAWLWDHSASVPLLGFPGFQDRPDIHIGSLFVQPRIGREALSLDSDEAAIREGATDFSTLLVQNPRVVLLGDPGSGKSTLVTWLLRTLSSRSNTDIKVLLGQYVPVPFVLRDLPISSRTASAESLLELLRSQPFWHEDLEEALPDLFERGQVLFLVDGYDEIPGLKVRQALRSAIWDAMERWPNCRWLITSRIVGYDEAPLHRRHAEPKPGADEQLSGMVELGLRENTAPTLPVFYLRPFHQGQIRAFIQNWHTIRVQEKARQQEMAEGLLRAITANTALQRLARNPSILALMALVHRVYAVLPSGRARLFDKLTEAYLDSLDQARKLPGYAIPLAARRRWLAELAFQMQRRKVEARGDDEATSAVLLSRAEAESILAPLASQEPTAAARASAVQDFLEHIARRSGLLVPRSETHLAFAHLSFQEYFCAQRLVDDLRANLIDPERASQAMDLLREWAFLPAAWESLVLLFESLADDRRFSSFLFQELVTKQAGVTPAGQNGGEQSEALARFSLALLEDEASGLSAVDREWARELVDGVVWAAVNRKGPYPYSCGKIPTWVTELPDLGRAEAIPSLVLEGCDRVDDLSPLVNARGLTQLRITKCENVADLGPLGRIAALRELSIWDCPQVADLGPLEGLVGLEGLGTGACRQVADLAPLAGLTNLKRLDVSHTTVADLGPLAGLTGLRAVRFSHCEKITDVAPLMSLHRLEELDAEWCETDFWPAVAGRRLRKLEIGHTPTRWEAHVLARWTQLKSLSLSDHQGLGSLEFLVGLNALKSLQLWDFSQVADLEPLARLSDQGQVTDLWLWGFSRIRDLSPLRAMNDLSRLLLGYCPAIQSLDGIPPKGRWSWFWALDCPNLTDISALRHLHGLQFLSLTDCPAIQDLSPLSFLTNLNNIDLSNCTSITDLSPLLKLPPGGKVKITGTAIEHIPPGLQWTVLR